MQYIYGLIIITIALICCVAYESYKLYSIFNKAHSVKTYSKEVCSQSIYNQLLIKYPDIKMGTDLERLIYGTANSQEA